jgi:hypothetical protein
MGVVFGVGVANKLKNEFKIMRITDQGIKDH